MKPVLRSQFLVLSFLPTLCFAHAFPSKTSPRVGAVIDTAPPQVVITFDDELEPVFSKIRIEDKDKKSVDRGDSHLDPKNHKTLEVGLKPALPPGEYEVLWHVISVDGHKTQGHFSFKIRPAHDKP